MTSIAHTPSSGKAAQRAFRANRRAVVLRAVGLVAILGAIALAGSFVFQVGLLAPPQPKDVKAEITIAKPEQVTGENSRITGLDRNQLPYEIRAKSGQQDEKIETLVHLQGVDGAFERPSGSKMDVTALAATFDTKSRDLQLQGDVVFSEGQRFKALMQKASVNMDDQTLISQSPVEVDMQGTLIKAESLSVTDNGSRILFRGGVKAHFVTKP